MEGDYHTFNDFLAEIAEHPSPEEQRAKLLPSEESFEDPAVAIQGLDHCLMRFLLERI